MVLAKTIVWHYKKCRGLGQCLPVVLVTHCFKMYPLCLELDQLSSNECCANTCLCCKHHSDIHACKSTPSWLCYTYTCIRATSMSQKTKYTCYMRVKIQTMSINLLTWMCNCQKIKKLKKHVSCLNCSSYQLISWNRITCSFSLTLNYYVQIYLSI